jgi:hypothetical protein
MKQMKISKSFLGALGVGVIACLLIAATLLVLHKPILQDNGWSGTQPISTTTPSAAIFPAAPDWSKDMLPISSPQGTPTLHKRAATTPFTTWTPLPPGIPTEPPTSQP